MRATRKRGGRVLLTIAVCAWAASAPGSQTSSAPPARAVLTLDTPKAGARVTAARGPDGLVRLTVRGSSQDVRNLRLLLWIRPTRPMGDGWYLQRPPVNGIGDVEPDGAWTGTAQIGNIQWPPRTGDGFDIAVTAIDRREASKLFAEEGVVLRPQPVGAAVVVAAGIELLMR